MKNFFRSFGDWWDNDHDDICIWDWVGTGIVFFIGAGVGTII